MKGPYLLARPTQATDSIHPIALEHVTVRGERRLPGGLRQGEAGEGRAGGPARVRQRGQEAGLSARA